MNEEKWPAGFQIANGKLISPRDLFDDPVFDTRGLNLSSLKRLHL